jgi:hypothetical protein
MHIFAEDEIAMEEGLRWAWLAEIGAIMLWDPESWQSIILRQLQFVGEAGLLAHLLLYVNAPGQIAIWCGHFATAASLTAEGDAIAEATGTRFARGSSPRRGPACSTSIVPAPHPPRD